ncbi:hypothetical protein ID866_12821 [Astraeus odoratus]|nr:hypothetical protein ID866_12821 [Astraeus odoratus]
MQSYLKGMALEWFEPDLLSSGNPGSCPLWMDNWTDSASNSSKGKPTTSSNTNSSSGNANSSLSNKSKSSNSGNKSSNATSSNPDLAGKLGKNGKLTLEEKKQHLDNKLCMFCREDGHFGNNCPKKANKGKAKAHAANATQSPQEQLGSTSGSAPEAKK